MEPEQVEQANSAAGTAGGVVGGLIGLVIAVLMVAAIWKVFVKAGEPGWAAIVPFYNLIVMLKIAGKPLWWIVLFLIPFVNFVMLILLPLGIAQKFGKGAGFGIGLVVLPFVFYPILGFGSATYVGPKTA